MDNENIISNTEISNTDNGIRLTNYIKNYTNPKRTLILSIIFTSLIIVIILLIVLVVNNNNNDITINTDNNKKVEVLDNKSFPIVLLNKDEIITKVIARAKGYPSDTQPENFDPSKDKYYLEDAGDNYKKYVIEGSEDLGPVMMINGYSIEGKDKINLESPFEMNVYYFSSASEISYVIEILKNGIRQSLYNHIDSFEISKDLNNIYMVYNVKSSNEWERVYSIINIKNNLEIELAENPCNISSQALWSNGRLLTYSEAENKSYSTDICIWSSEGVLENRVGTTSTWITFSISILGEQIGFVNNENIFYAYTSSYDKDNSCSIYIIDLDNFNPNSSHFYEVISSDQYNIDENYFCIYPEVEFDFKNFNKENMIFDYRIGLIENNEKKWGEWKNAQFE